MHAFIFIQTHIHSIYVSYEHTLTLSHMHTQALLEAQVAKGKQMNHSTLHTETRARARAHTHTCTHRLCLRRRLLRGINWTTMNRLLQKALLTLSHIHTQALLEAQISNGKQLSHSTPEQEREKEKERKQDSPVVARSWSPYINGYKLYRRICSAYVSPVSLLLRKSTDIA